MDQKQNGIRPYLFFNQIQTYRVHVEKKSIGLEKKGEKTVRPRKQRRKTGQTTNKIESLTYVLIRYTDIVVLVYISQMLFWCPSKITKQ